MRSWKSVKQNVLRVWVIFVGGDNFFTCYDLGGSHHLILEQTTGYIREHFRKLHICVCIHIIYTYIIMYTHISICKYILNEKVCFNSGSYTYKSK